MSNADVKKDCEKINPYLDMIDFRAEADGNKFRLIDLTGANWGDIESERFESAADVIVRLDIYWDDCFLGDEYDGPAGWKTYEDVSRWYREDGNDYMADEIDDFIRFYDSVVGGKAVPV